MMSGLPACVHGSAGLFSPAQAHTCLLPQQRGAAREGEGRQRLKVGMRYEREGSERKNMGVSSGKSQTPEVCLERIDLDFLKLIFHLDF